MTEADPSKIKYVALKLDEAGRRRLVSLESELFGDFYPNVYCDHLTLAYGLDQVAAFDQALFGMERELEIWNVVHDANAAAAAIDSGQLEGLGVNNERPHVTMATASGVRPVYSNELLAGYFDGVGQARAVQLDEPVVVAAKVEPVFR